MKKRLLSLALAVVTFAAQAQDAKSIVQKADQKLRGQSSKSELTIQIVRPTWQREMGVKSWTKGDDLSVILITSPAKDEGTAFLKRGNEIWNWVPTIERTIKLPPSMMSQNWMGTDFTNDDLVKQSSIVDDYDHKIIGDTTLLNRPCWIIQMLPKPEAAVVWGKVVLCVDKKDYMELLSEFYDEDGYKVNIMKSSDVKTFDGKILPSRMEMIPVDEPGQKTVLIYKSLQFGVNLPDRFFTLQNIKQLR